MRLPASSGGTSLQKGPGPAQAQLRHIALETPFELCAGGCSGRTYVKSASSFAVHNMYAYWYIICETNIAGGSYLIGLGMG